MITERSRAAHSASAEQLASCVLDALSGAGDTAVVAAHLHAAHHDTEPSAPDGGRTVAAAAVRVLGADVLAPYALGDSPLPSEEADALRVSLSALPPALHAPAAPPDGPEGPWTRAWIDWGLVTVLARLARPAPDVPAPRPGPPPPCADAAPRHHRVGGPAGPAGTLDRPGPGEGWVPWSLRMARLASLALPGLDGPVHDSARTGALALSRGATRAFLRRDFFTAARLVRWLAWLDREGETVPLDTALLIQDLALRGGGRRCALDAAIAGRLLGLETA